MIGQFCGHPAHRLLVLIVFSLARPVVAQSSSLQNLQTANGLLQRGMYDMAAREYRAFLEEHSDHKEAPVARYGLAVCYFKTSEYEKAEKQLARLEGRRFPYAAEVLTMLGQCRLLREDYSGACEAFGRVLGEHGDHKLAPDAAAQFSEALYRGERLKEAVGCCASFSEKWPDDPLRARVELFAGLAEIKLGDDRSAADRFDRLLQRDAPAPIARHAALLAAQCRHRLGDMKPAAAHYEAVLADADNDYRGDALHGLGVLRLQDGEASGAAKLFRSYLSEYAEGPHRAAVLLNLGRCLFDLEQFDESAAQLKLAAEADPALADEAEYWTAKGLLRRGRYADAATNLERAAAAHPDSRLRAEMTYDRGVALFRAGKFAEAAAVLHGFLDRHRDHAMTADALELTAVCLHRKGDYDAAAKACRRFLSRYKDHALKPSVTFLLAENAYVSGAFEDAVNGYRRFIEQFANDDRALAATYRLGMALHRLKRFDEASEYLSNVVAGGGDEPAFRSARFALGDIAFEKGDWKRAGEWLAEYVKTPPPGAALDEPLIKLGLSRQRRDDAAGAIACYDRIIAEYADGPHALQARFEKGQALLAAGKDREAEAVFKSVLNNNADSRFAPFARNHLGQLALKRGDFDRAAEFLADVDDKSVDATVAADALFRRAQAQMASGDYKPASQSFARFLKKHDEHALAATAAVQRAICVARDGHPQRAIELFDQADWKGIDPAVADAARYEWGWCLKSLGRNEEAASVFRKLVEAREPRSPHLHAMLELADIESAAERYDRAAVLLQRICKLGEKEPDAAPAVLEQAAYRLGLCAFQRGDHKKAAEVLGRFIKQYPDSASIVSANALCGVSLFHLGNHVKAAACFQRVVDSDADDAATAAAWLRLGESSALMQKWARSEEAFARYLDRFADEPAWYQAAFGLGWARENQGRHDEAMASYRDVVERHQGPTAARAQFQIGECLFAKKQYEEAAGALLKVDILYAYPEWSAAALFEAGRCFEKLGKLVEARQQFQRVVERHGDTEWAKMARARFEETSVAGLPGR